MAKKFSEAVKEKNDLTDKINLLIEEFQKENPTVRIKEGYPFVLACDFNLATYNFSTE